MLKNYHSPPKLVAMAVMAVDACGFPDSDQLTTSQPLVSVDSLSRRVKNFFGVPLKLAFQRVKIALAIKKHDPGIVGIDF